MHLWHWLFLKPSKMKSVNIIPITIAAAAFTGTKTLTLDKGVNVFSVKAFSSNAAANHNNPGMVRAEIKVNGNVVCALQPLDNFRSKDGVSFEYDGIPIHEDISGCDVEANVIAPNAFTAPVAIDFVFSIKPRN